MAEAGESEECPGGDTSWRGPLIAACAAVGLVLGGLLVGYEPVGGDPDRIFRPIKAELARTLREGRVPFWSDRFGLGVPLVAESHAAAFYPPNALLYRLLDVGAAYRLAMWLHYVALAASTFAYGRVVGLSPWGASLAGVAFTLCGFQAVQSSHEWAYHTLAYLPLCLALADRHAATGRASWLAGLALAWGVQLTLGHFQVAMWTAALVLATGGWRAAAAGAWWRAAGLAAGLCWGGGVAAVQVAPTWELAQAVGQTRRSVAELSFYSFPPSHLVELAVPGLFRAVPGGPEARYWFEQQTTGFEASLYVGTIPFALACAGAVGGRGLGAWRWIVPLSLALATMPRWWPAGYAAVLAVPGLGLFRCPARYTAVTSLGLALMAGAGLDRLMAPRRFAAGLGLAAVLALAAFAVVMRPEAGAVLGEPGRSSRLALAGCAWGVGLAAVWGWRRGTFGAWVPVGLTAVELGLLYYSGTTRWGWSVPLPEASPVLSRLAATPSAVRVAGPLDNLPVRAGCVAASPYFGFPMPPPHALLKQLTERNLLHDPAAATWLRRLGVSHVVTEGRPPASTGPGVYSGPDAALDRLAYHPPGTPERRTWTLTELPSPFPAARVATRSEILPDRTTLVATLARAESADVAHYLPGDAPPGGDGLRARSARVVSWDGRAAEVEHDSPCDLILTRTAYPGWVARVDGGPPRPVTPVDGGLQAVRLVGAGRTRVSVAYEPTGWRAALGLSVASVASAAAVIAAVGLKRGPPVRPAVDRRAGTSPLTDPTS